MGAVSEGGAICWGVGRQYVSRVRLEGVKEYQVLGYHRSYRAAVRRMSDAFAANHGYMRGEVLLIAEYYDPIQVCEIKR